MPCRCTISIANVLLISALAYAQTAEPLIIAGLKPAPGTIAAGKIDIPAGSSPSDPATQIPLAIIRGAKPGPVLAVIAGFGGTEYGPIVATYELLKELKPAEIRGTLIVVHMANVPAFLEHSIYLNPIDRKDLGRSFPGKADGTSSERIAYALTHDIIEKSDSVLLIDAGGTNTMMQPFVYQTLTGDAKLDAQIGEMALAFGINNIVVEKDPKRPADPAQSVTPDNTSLTRGKPVLRVMCGSFGVADGRTVGSIIRGIESELALAGLSSGTVTKTRVPFYFDHTVAIMSPATGILTSLVQRGQEVHRGDPLFIVSNFNNKNPVGIPSAGNGIVLAVMLTPPVNKGDAVILMGIPRPGQ
ncbi:MAG TPA: succinylglutamate desuccinylase/aspartoacylase family protein [Bryobacteraceae bacterium]|jgi:hypothetical protein